MFSIFKANPAKKLRKVYDRKLEQAMLLQRKGDIRGYSMMTAEAEEIWKQIQQIETQPK